MMETQILVDYTKETKELLVCSHETTGDSMSILAGSLTLRVNKAQARDLVNGLNISINIIDDYSKMIKRAGGNEQ